MATSTLGSSDLTEHETQGRKIFVFHTEAHNFVAEIVETHAEHWIIRNPFVLRPIEGQNGEVGFTFVPWSPYLQPEHLCQLYKKSVLAVFPPSGNNIINAYIQSTSRIITPNAGQSIKKVVLKPVRG